MFGWVPGMIPKELHDAVMAGEHRPELMASLTPEWYVEYLYRMMHDAEVKADVRLSAARLMGQALGYLDRTSGGIILKKPAFGKLA